MTNTEKNMLINYMNENLKKYTVDRYDPETGNTNIIPTWRCEDVLNVIKETITNEMRCQEKASMDAELGKVKEDAAHWKHVADVMQERNRDLETILNTFEFIFGRKFEG